MAFSSYFFQPLAPRLWRVLASVALVCLAVPVHADPDDHDRALLAVRQGQALSLQDLMERVPTLRQGHMLEVELERKQGRWVYEIKSLESGGRLVRRKFDARTGELLQSNAKAQP